MDMYWKLVSDSSYFHYEKLWFDLCFFPQTAPVLVVALEKVERSSGSLVGNSIATMQKSTAPEVIIYAFAICMYFTNTLYWISIRILIVGGYRCFLHSWMKLILDQQ